MKVLCSADWHLGKRTEGKSRLDDQKAVLDFLAGLVKAENIDVMIVAGDVFDTSVPTSEAEGLFFDYAEIFGKDCLFVVLSGNHDDGDRLCAALPLSQKHNVLLYGGKSVSVVRDDLKADDRGFSYTKNGQTLNVAILPYPSESAVMLGEDESYSEVIGEKIKSCTSIFKEGDFNIFASHLFMVGGERTNNDERELGTAKILPTQVLPDCDFTVLGHIHKPMLVSSQKNAHYTGSILQYSFDDTSEKRVMIVQKDGDVCCKSVKIEGGRGLKRVQAGTVDEAIELLDNTEDLLEITYTGDALSPLDYNKIRRKANFVKLKMPVVVQTRTAHRKNAGVGELFSQFYKSKKGKEPDEELVSLFVEYVEREEGRL